MMPKGLYNKISWSSTRWLFALLALLIIVAGQYLIISPGIQSTSSNVGIWINNALHVDISNIDNVIQGFLLFFLGGGLLAYAIRGFGLFTQNQSSFEKKPVYINKIVSFWPWILFGIILFVWLLLPLSSLGYLPSSPVLWILVLLIFTVIMGLWDSRRGVSLSLGLTRQDLLWLIGLVVAGLVICTYRLQGWPDQLMGDEGIFGSTARDIATGKFTPPVFAQGVDGFPILSTYWQAGVMKIFGVTIWGWRFGSVLPGVLSAVPLYLFLRDSFNRRIAIISSGILFTNPYFLVYSHLGYTNIQPVFIIALALYLLYSGLHRKSNLFLFLAGCAAGLGFYTYFSGRAALVIAIVFIALLWLMKQLKFREFIYAMTLLASGTILVAAPHIVYGFIQNSQGMGYRIFLSFFNSVAYGSAYYSNTDLIKYAPIFQMGGTDVFYNPKIYLVLIIRGFVQTLLAYQKPGLLWGGHYLACPLAGTLGAIFYLVGLVISLRYIKQPRVLLVVVWFFTILTFFSALNTFPPREDHMAAIVSALAILTGFGVNAIAEGIVSRSGRLRNTILLTLLTGVMVGGVFDYYVAGPRNFPQRPADIISWAGLNSHGESFIYVYQDPSQLFPVPFVISEFRRDIPFKIMTLDEAVHSYPSFNNDKKTVVFYPPEFASRITPILQAQWGNSLIERTFLNSEGAPVLEGGMNTSFIFERDRSFFSTLLDGFHQYPFDIFLLILLGLFVITAYIPSAWITSIHDRIKHLKDWFCDPVLASTPEEQNNLEGTNVGLLSSSITLIPQSYEPTHRPGRFSIQARFVRHPDEKELDISIRLPKIRLPRPRFYNGLELSLSYLDIPHRFLLISSIFLAAVAQLLIYCHIFLPGILFYLAAAAGLITWARRNPKLIDYFTNQLQVSPKIDLAITLLLFLVIAFTRFYDLRYRVYGLDVDEAKWTSQSWYSNIAQVNGNEFTAHEQLLPIDLWVRSIFLRAFGLSFMSARIESAFISLFSAVLLYFFVRRLSASRPLAWLTTALYSFSFVELSSSHQALPESTLELWLIGTLFIFALAIREQERWQFQLSGVLAALGIFFYNAFLLIPIVMIVYLLSISILMIVRKKNIARTWLQAFFLTALPIVLAYFLLIYIHQTLQDNYFANMLVSSGNSATFSGWVLFLLKNLGNLFSTLFSQITAPDSLVNWSGSLINPVLLPFIVMGAVYSLLNTRREQFVFLIVWFLIEVFVAQILFGSVDPKSLYIVLIPLMIWGAFGLWVFLAALRALYERRGFKYAIPVFVMLIIAIISIDYHIFTTSLLETVDNQKRLEFSNLTAEFARTVPMIFFPQIANETLENEVILLSANGGGRSVSDAGDLFQQMDFGQILPALQQYRHLTGIDLLFDKTSCSQGQCRDALDLALKCYPGADISESDRFFDIYQFDADILSHPKCYQSEQPSLTIPMDGSTLQSGSPITLQWNPKDTDTTGYSVTLDRKVAGTYWIEVEDAFQGTGWNTNSDFVDGFNGNGFLFDDFQSGDASYLLNIPEEGRFHLWVRSYKRVVNDQNNFIQVNGRKMQFAGNNNELNDWVWEDLGVIDLPEGPLPIILSRTYGSDEEYSVFIDTLVLTTNLADHPDTIKNWENVLSTGEITSPAKSYELGNVLSPGEYRWEVRIFDGNKLVDATGARGLLTDSSTFIVKP